MKTVETTTGEMLRETKNRLGDDILIAAHYYAVPEVKRWADEIGDSLELAQLAAGAGNARALVFCGVSFMAETAAVLSGPERPVFLPRLEAGCPLADSATAEGAGRAWTMMGPVARDFVPVTYVNSSTELKAFCGARGGATCTSSSARDVFAAVEEAGRRVFFLPDINLGRNTARSLGIRDEEISVFDPDTGDFGGSGAPGEARMLVWKGSCPVHLEFLPHHVAEARKDPATRIAVHPECSPEVCRLADEVGSTSHMVRSVAESPRDVRWAIGTEINLIKHLRNLHPHRTIDSLGPARSCRDMHLTTETDLLETLAEFERGDESRRVSVSGILARDALAAIDRMLRVLRGEALKP